MSSVAIPAWQEDILDACNVIIQQGGCKWHTDQKRCFYTCPHSGESVPKLDWARACNEEPELLTRFGPSSVPTENIFNETPVEDMYLIEQSDGSRVLVCERGMASVRLVAFYSNASGEKFGAEFSEEVELSMEVLGVHRVHGRILGAKPGVAVSDLIGGLMKLYAMAI